ncbi:DUF397 domain-containing protein [Streptomyces sp. NPDC052095]|uniref:DUF397 domain-containing protein n=1 Tax=unclassified Streptomyces TaxID=2593676 RepID=UPI00344E1505
MASESGHVIWKKSSRSGAGNNCVKVVAPSVRRAYVGVCDSKQENGPAFTVRPQVWKAFVASVA